MSNRYSRVQSFPSPDHQIVIPCQPPLRSTTGISFAPKPHNLQQVRRISTEHLSKVLDDAIAAQKTGAKLAGLAIVPSTGQNSNWNFINYYLDGTIQLLDACTSMQLRLEKIRTCLGPIKIGLHCLEGEHELSRTVLRRTAAALESSCLTDRRHCTKMEKLMSSMRISGKKLGSVYQEADGSISPDLYKALTGAWAMAVFAIGELYSATSLKSVQSMEPKPEPWTARMNELSKVFPKKTYESSSMEELKAADTAVKTLLKLVLASQKSNGGVIRRLAVKAVAGELQRRGEQLEKAMPQIEAKIGELYKLVGGLRMSMLEVLLAVRKEEVVELEKPCGRRKSETEIGNWIKVQKGLMTARTFSINRIGTRSRVIKRENQPQLDMTK